ncbi:MAG: hypothetical protein D6731_05330 [Planctomycetota bacterium]|nr:MAG: hypothetical protein D6731_05330 [Planctomycetota bacterium]
MKADGPRPGQGAAPRVDRASAAARSRPCSLRLGEQAGRLAAAALLVFAAAAPAGAEWRWSARERKQIAALEARVEKGKDFPFRLEGRRWNVETAVSARFTAELALFMDSFSDAFDGLMKELDAEPLVERKPTVQVYASRADYAKQHTNGSRGYYRYRWDADGRFTELHLYTFVEWPREREFSRFYHPILLHEGTHVLLRVRLGKAANVKWLDEGTATWFQFYDLRASVKANRKTRARRSTFRKDLARALAKGPRLSDLLSLGPLTFNPDGMGPKALEHYGLAESFVDFLLSSRRGAEVYKQAFHRLREGKVPLLEPALVARLEGPWLAHARRVAGR